MDIDTLAKNITADSKRWFPSSYADLTMLTLGINGEAGEVADIVKKITRGTTTVQKELNNLREELIDVLIYVLQAGELLQLDWDVEYAKKRTINEIRFGKGHPSANGR
jgi:NTP pyrophosphatase (non-canonical NTP hydrolase)